MVVELFLAHRPVQTIYFHTFADLRQPSTMGNIPHTPTTQSQHHDDSNSRVLDELEKNNDNIKSWGIEGNERKAT